MDGLDGIDSYRGIYIQRIKTPVEDGLRIGDKVVGVNDQSVAEMSP